MPLASGSAGLQTRPWRRGPRGRPGTLRVSSGCRRPPPTDRALPVPHQRPRHRAEPADQLPPAGEQVLARPGSGSAPRRQPPGVAGHHRQHRQLGRGAVLPGPDRQLDRPGTTSRTGPSRPARSSSARPGPAADRPAAARRPAPRQRPDRRVHPIRSAITVAGIVGHACSNSRIRGSTASTTDPAGARAYFGGPSAASAARTVFLETPSARAITLIGIPSARCNRRISAQSSTTTPASSLTSTGPGSRQGVSFRPAAWGSVFTRRRQLTMRPGGGRCPERCRDEPARAEESAALPPCISPGLSRGLMTISCRE